VEGWAIVDGRLVPLTEATVPVTDVGFTHGWSIFETLEAGPGHDPTLNFRRLRQSGMASLIDVPTDTVLNAEVDEVVAKMGGKALVRITITGDGRRIVWATPPEPERRHAPVRCARGDHIDQAFLDGSVKHRSRMGWMVAIQRAGVDEVLFVDADDRFTEGTSCAVLAVVDGVVWTAPWDGRILRSTTLSRLLGLCQRLGIPVVREGASAEGPWDGLYIASTTRSIAPVAELDGEALPTWDPVGRRLADADDL
jgi:branched-subunit amino acid aminotransferase/4-amino-4-deoxychorismate lyase